MEYPKGKDYEIMYRRYFQRPVSELIDLAHLLPHSDALDLCGGTGRLTWALLEAGHRVTYVDESREMLVDTKNMLEENFDKPNMCDMNYQMTVFDYLNYATHFDIKFEAIFCQQAINYWFKKADIAKLAKILKPDGYFIFNTFKRKPDIIPVTTQYVIDDRHYTEISYCIDDVVYHIQVCEGYSPHFTKFDYISNEEFVNGLSPYFDVNLHTRGKTSIYECKKKI